MGGCGGVWGYGGGWCPFPPTWGLWGNGPMGSLRPNVVSVGLGGGGSPRGVTSMGWGLFISTSGLCRFGVVGNPPLWGQIHGGGSVGSALWGRGGWGPSAPHRLYGAVGSRRPLAALWGLWGRGQVMLSVPMSPPGPPCSPPCSAASTAAAFSLIPALLLLLLPPPSSCACDGFVCERVHTRVYKCACWRAHICASVCSCMCERVLTYVRACAHVCARVCMWMNTRVLSDPCARGGADVHTHVSALVSIPRVASPRVPVCPPPPPK